MCFFNTGLMLHVQSVMTEVGNFRGLGCNIIVQMKRINLSLFCEWKWFKPSIMGLPARIYNSGLSNLTVLYCNAQPVGSCRGCDVQMRKVNITAHALAINSISSLTRTFRIWRRQISSNILVYDTFSYLLKIFLI